MENIYIDNAKLKDVDEVYELICRFMKTTLDYSSFVEIYRRNLSDNNVIYLGAYFENKIVGFMGIHIQHLLHHCSQVAEVLEIIVHEDFRQKNIGRKLLRFAERNLNINGVEEVEVTFNNEYASSVKFYTENGYTPSHSKFTKKLQ